MSPDARVLIVDDAVDIRQMLALMINRSPGYVVAGEAADGRVGVEQARLLCPDVVLLDLAMTVMDGLEALPLIRAVCPEARIIVFSGFDAAGLKEQALGLGADGFLTKGGTRQEIIGMITQGRQLASPPPSSVAVQVAPGESVGPASQLAPWSDQPLTSTSTVAVPASATKGSAHLLRA